MEILKRFHPYVVAVVTVFVMVALMILAKTALADVLALKPAGTVTIVGNAGGTNSAVIEAGWYVVTVSNETTSICYAATCPSGGADLGPANHGITYVKSTTTVSARSSGGSGRVQFVPGEFIR